MQRTLRATTASFVAIVATATLLVAAPAAAQVPFGFFDGIVGSPQNNGVSGVVPLAGWALDDSGVQRVEIYVDGRLSGQATLGFFRPGVAAGFPGFPDSDSAGWGFQLDTTHFLNGLHSVNPLVVSESGERRFLNGRVFQFTNTTHLLKPFGRIEAPFDDAELFGTCNPNQQPRRLTPVSGWALDVGTEIGDFGVGYVELLLDGSIIANTVTDCFFTPGLGGWVDCYGVRRVDIERAFQLIKDAPHAGYRFVVDVGALLNNGWREGRHVFTVRVGDVSGQVADVDEIPVTFRCDDVLGNEASFGGIDLPLGGIVFAGTVEVTGFAVDFEGVSQVQIFVDGDFVGFATLGLARPGVAASFPGYPDADTAGWRFLFDSTELSDGFHDLQAIVVDDLGDTVLIGERQFRIHNDF
jgi:hypothetical protein